MWHNYYPTISAIVLSDGSGNNIYQALDSVLDQDYPHIELLVCDNHSQSFDCKKIEQYINTHKRPNIVRVIIDQNIENYNTVRYWEKIRHLETGEIELFISNNDYWADERVFSDFVARFEELGTDAKWIISQSQMHTAAMDSETIPMIELDVLNLVRNGNMSELLNIELERNALPKLGSAVRVGFFDEIGSLSDSYTYLEDYPSYIRLLRNGNFVHLLDRVTTYHKATDLPSGNCDCITDRCDIARLRDLCQQFVQEIFPYQHLFSEDAFSSAKKLYSESWTALLSACRQAAMSNNEIMQLKNSEAFFPLLSVLVVTYNQEQFVCDALDSIRHQDYPNLELLICDDCSTDRTDHHIRRWIKSLQDGELYRVKYIRGDTNIGISGNLNRGVDVLNGKYVKPLAGDDALEYNCISAMFRAMEDDNIDIAFCREYVFHDTLPLDTTDLEIRPSKNSEAIFSLPSLDAYKALVKACTYPAPTVMLNSSSLRACGGYSMEYPLMEDYPLWFKAHKMGLKISFVPKALVYYRVSDSSISNRDNTSANAFRIAFHKSLLKFTDTVRLPEALKYHVQLNSMSSRYDCDTHTIDYDETEIIRCSEKLSVLLIDNGTSEQLKLTLDSIAAQKDANIDIAISLHSSHSEADLEQVLTGIDFSGKISFETAHDGDTNISRLCHLISHSDGNSIIWLNSGDIFIRSDALCFCQNAIKTLDDNEYAIGLMAFFEKDDNTVVVAPDKSFIGCLKSNTPLTRLGNTLARINEPLPVFVVKRELFSTAADILNTDDNYEYPEVLFLWRLLCKGFRCPTANISIMKKKLPVRSSENIREFYEKEVFPVIGAFPRNITTICANQYLKTLSDIYPDANDIPDVSKAYMGLISTFKPLPPAKNSVRYISDFSVSFSVTRMKFIRFIFMLGLIILTLSNILSLFESTAPYIGIFYIVGLTYILTSALLLAYKILRKLLNKPMSAIKKLLKN